MSFLTPLFLLGALAIAIPVILHLINFRKPNKQAFSTLVFFQQLQKSSIRWLILKKRILLALRILAILLLTLALARPLLSPKLSGIAPDRGSTLYAIVIENSPAMSQIDERGLLFNTATEAIKSLIANSKPSDRFLIYNTHGQLLSPEEISAAQAERLLDQLEPLNAGNFTTERLSRLASKAISTELDAVGLFFITRGGEYLDGILSDLTLPDDFRPGLYPLTLITTGEQPARNTGIVSIDVAARIISGGSPVSVMVTVQNFSDQRAVNHFLSLEVNGELEGQFQVDLDAGETRVYSFETIAPERGNLKGRALLEGDAFSFDNTRYFVIDIPERTRILLLSELQTRGSARVSWLDPVFRAAARSAGNIDVINATWDDWTGLTLSEFDAVLLDGVREVPEYAWNELQNFTQNGGGLVLIPGNRGNPSSLNPFLERMNAGRFIGMVGDPGRFEPVARVDRIVRGHPIFDDMFQATEEEELRLDLPALYHYWRYQSSGRAAQIIMRTNLDDPLLIRESAGNGRFIIAATSPDPTWSAFAINPLFAPLFLRVGLYAAAGELGGLNEFILGNMFNYTANGLHRNATFQLNDFSLVPETQTAARETRITAETYAWKPGWATLALSEDTLHIAVNQNVQESSFKTLNMSKLGDIFSEQFQVSDVISLQGLSEQDITRRIGVAATGREIWSWFLLAAIVMLVTESLVAARFKGNP